MSEINELRRELEKVKVSHKLLKAKVSDLSARVRAVEIFSYAKERDEFIDYVNMFIKEKRRNFKSDD